DRDKYEPEDLVDAYMSLPEVKDVLENGFDGFHTRYGRDTYSLVGSAAGRTVQLYQMKEAGETGSQAVSENWLVNDKNAKLTGTTLLYDQMPMRWWWLYFNEDDFNDPYINSSSLQYDCGGRLAGFLQGSRYVLPTLRPGKYDGNDWAYYNIADYAEINGYYQVNNGGFVCGHSQPLVSSGMYKSLDRDVWYSNLKNELVKAASAQVYADDAGDLRINGGAVWGNVDKARYYYNNTLDNGFSLIHEAGRYTSSFRGNAQDTVVKAAGNKSYQTYDELVKYGGRVYLDHMLQKNVPVSLIRIDPLDAEDGSQRHYATFGNDNRNTYVLPTMIMTDTETVRLDHTWYLSAGSENYEIKSISANVTLPSRYRMVYPEGTYIQSTGDTWVGSMVKAGADDLPALNYYSVKGSKLASEAVWKSYFGLFYTRAWESDYPIYDNASNTRFNVLSDYGWFLRWYYYNNVFWDFYGGANSEKTFSTIQEQNLGKHGDIYDRMVPGEAVDLGIWQVGNKKIVAYFTDQVIRFYEPGGGPMYGTYRATRQISIDELRGITPGYILKEEDENAVSATSDAQEDKESAAKANEALTDDDAEFKLNASNILPVKEDLSQFIYFSTDGGMHLLYITDSLQADTTSSDGKTIDNSWRRRGRIMSMMEGSYSGVFQTGSQYKVVGFQTQEYSYSAADTCMAEVYDLNIGTMIRNHGVTAIEEYMKGLRNLYLTQTHTIRKSLDENGNQVVTIVQPDETEAEFKRAKTIMIGTLEAAEAELKDICVEFGMDTVPEASENLLSQLRSNYQQQRAALAELYTFLGIDSTKLEGNWRYLQFEGQMFNASYQRILEMTMVQIVLSDFYLDDQITPQTGGIAGLMGIHKYDPSVEEDGAPGLRFVYNDASASGNLIHLYDPETDEDAENNKTEAAGPGLTPLGLPIVTNFNKVLYVDEFYKYRVQYKRWQIDEAQKKIMESLSDDAAAEAANRDLAADKISETLENKMNDVMANDEDYQNLESRDFYQAIADALEDKYLTGLRLQEQERAGQETARTQAAETSGR
ncbi:MAG: hypothetical protein IJ600_11295, partial [Lachnospiraceae bacterium]|nr:hypothetical protein [Lachnospiraceae bacterium]